MIYIYNSLSNKKEEFKPIKKNEITMYVCGPTVYDDIHIGNSRPLVFFDVVYRFFKFVGYNVNYVSNFTDIDDKIIKRAKDLNINESSVSEKYIKRTKKLYNDLNLLPHNKNPKVTENMNHIIKTIKDLVDNNSAYEIEGDVYFDCSCIPNYGILSNQTIENLENGARVDSNPKKRNQIDFTLWKKTEEGLKWDSPWGQGRPGWHTECVSMIYDIFKGPIDLHGGGYDLKFPHHDNEIAQASCLFKEPLANYWMHNGFINLVGQKMSKSLGNIIKCQDLVDEIGYLAYRFFILNVPYRQMLNFHDDLVKQAKAEIEKIKRTAISCHRYFELENIFFEQKDIYDIASSNILELQDEYCKFLSDDFNTPNAISIINKVTKLINVSLRSKSSDLVDLYKVYQNMLWILGLNFEIERLTSDELELVKNWQKAKENKDFILADKLRLEITNRNIIL